MKYLRKRVQQVDMTATPSKYPQKVFEDKGCRKCSVTFSPQSPSHLYCSQECADEAATDAYLTRNYGIKYLDYTRMLDTQNNLCAICHTEGWTMAEHHKLKLVVDHCHTTGKVRGLLCHNCNRALGLLQDSRTILESSLKYLEGATTIRKE